jgi:hypothetical protein
MNYKPFNSFLRVDTWHTSHPLDDQRFFQCLHDVVREPDFSAEAMGEYMRAAKQVESDDHPFAQRIDSLVRKAWAVREYLEATRQL